MSTVPGEKRLIRTEVLSRRDALNSGAKKSKDKKIRERMLGLPEFIQSRTVLFYASFRSEVDTMELLHMGMRNGKTVVLPRVDYSNTSLKLYSITSIDDLVPGHFGIPEPFESEDRRVTVAGLDLIIVPGVAFDEHCNRLGYGKGFYDRLLSYRTAPAVALAYEEQIVKNIPTDAHDIKMDKIISDTRTIYCNGH